MITYGLRVSAPCGLACTSVTPLILESDLLSARLTHSTHHIDLQDKNNMQLVTKLKLQPEGLTQCLVITAESVLFL